MAEVPSLTDDRLDALVAILDAIRHGRAATRPELVRRTGLGRGVVSQRVSELVRRGLVEESGTGRSSGGRAPRLLRLRAQAGHLLVADVGASSIGAGIADLGGRILAHADEPADVASGPEIILDRVHGLFEELLARSPGVPGTLWGIGVGLPGPVEFGTGRPVAPPIMPGWDGFGVRETFAARYDVPVWVDNDSNLMALGELRAGIARDHLNVVFVKLGTGIGGGLIAAGQLHRGAQGCAGEIGHVRVTEDPAVVCRCGKVGCLGALASGWALSRQGERVARADGGGLLGEVLARKGYVDASDVSWAAAHGDPASRDLIAETGRRVGQALAQIVNVFDPSLIVIGGGVARAGDLLLAATRESIYARSLPLATRDLLVKRTSLEGLGGLIGAAAMVADELFARERLRQWLDAGEPAGRPELAAR